MLPATALVIVLGCVAVLQIALACGAPLGRLAFGGQHERELPRPLRVASAITVLIYAAIAIIALDRARVIDVVPSTVSQVGSWVAFAIFLVGVIPNAVSRSRSERYVMTPTTVVLAVLALVVALSPAA